MVVALVVPVKGRAAAAAGREPLDRGSWIRWPFGWPTRAFGAAAPREMLERGIGCRGQGGKAYSGLSGLAMPSWWELHFAEMMGDSDQPTWEAGAVAAM